MLTDTEARKIASEWHGGGGTALYAFASSGAIDTARPDHCAFAEVLDALRAELGFARGQAWPSLDVARNAPDYGELGELLSYIGHHGTRGPQPGWADLS